VVPLRLDNEDQPADGEQTQSIQINAYVQGTSDNGSSFSAQTIGGIEFYKADDYYNAAGNNEDDGGIRFYIPVNGSNAYRWFMEGNYLVDVTQDLGFSGAGIFMDSTGVINWSSTGAYSGAADVQLSRYTPDAGTTTYLELDQAGTASDGTGTGRLILGEGLATSLALAFGAYSNNVGFYVSGGAIIQRGSSFALLQDADLSTGSVFLIRQNGATRELTDTNGFQAGAWFGDIEAAQSGTAAVALIGGNLNITSVGDGSTGNGNNVLELRVDGSPVWRVSTAGVLTRAAEIIWMTINPEGATVGVTAPVAALIGTFPALAFDADAETVSFTREIPGDWDGVSDLTFRTYWCAESGDAVAAGETVKLDISMRSIDFAGGEAYDNGSAYTASDTYTQAGGGDADKQCYEQDITLVYNNANQPFAAGDQLGITFNRDVSTDTYSGDVQVTKWEIGYSSVSIPDHM